MRCGNFLVVHMSKPVLLIFLVVAAIAVGAGVIGGPPTAHAAAMAAPISVIAMIVALLPLRFAVDRSAVNLFQSAWIGSIVHMAIFVIAGGAIIFSLAPSSAFVIWLLAFYWITLIGLCFVMIKTLRSAAPYGGGALATQQAIEGE
jgi:hypothetical protein